MPHLTETEFIDLLDGALASDRVTHVEGCRQCSAQADALTETLASIDVEGEQTPSPLFWNTFPARVAAAIDGPGIPVWWRRPVVAGLACAAALLLAVAAGVALRDASDSSAVHPATVTAPDAVLPLDDDVEQDAAWAVVRTVADELDYDDALAAGISARPGAAEHAAMELSDAERAELARLIEREIKRSGA